MKVKVAGDTARIYLLFLHWRLSSAGVLLSPHQARRLTACADLDPPTWSPSLFGSTGVERNGAPSNRLRQGIDGAYVQCLYSCVQTDVQALYSSALLHRHLKQMRFGLKSPKSLWVHLRVRQKAKKPQTQWECGADVFHIILCNPHGY